MIDGAMAGSFTRGCAARDLQILFLVEEQEASGLVSPEKLSDALIEMMHARIVCHEGRVLDALTIYDAVAESLRAIRSGRARRGHPLMAYAPMPRMSLTERECH
jgi:hypothetical protein